MFTQERYQYIIDKLNNEGKVLVKDLSNEFQMSESMIRKDLQVLEKKNLLQRTYGGAICKKSSIIPCESFGYRIDKKREEKEVVAQKAVDLIRECETVFLDVSTISYLIARYVIQRDMDITIISNMYEIATLIPEKGKTRFIFIGGDYSPIVGGSIGSYTCENIKQYRCNKAFLGCAGINLSDGTVSTTISEDASTKRTIIEVSEEHYLLMLGEKFGVNGSFPFSNLEDYIGVITNTIPDDEVKLVLADYSVKII